MLCAQNEMHTASPQRQPSAINIKVIIHRVKMILTPFYTPILHFGLHYCDAVFHKMKYIMHPLKSQRHNLNYQFVTNVSISCKLYANAG